MMSKVLGKFDAAATLRDADAIAEYMAAALETEDPGYISYAFGTVARARGMTEIARESGLSREHLYRSFSEDGNPTLKSILAVMGVLGVSLTATTLHRDTNVAGKAGKKVSTTPSSKKAVPVSRREGAARVKKHAVR
jgi:probable addiction module antidote protein